MLTFTHDNKGVFYQRYPEPVGVKDAGTETTMSGNAMVHQTLMGLMIGILSYYRDRTVGGYPGHIASRPSRVYLQCRRQYGRGMA
jgi:hypothetical protein